MPRVIYHDSQGQRREVEVARGNSVMEGAVDNDVAGIVAECGGACACATCHVYVDETWLPRLETANSDESMMLDEAYEVRDNSRLSCQIKFGPALDGLEVTLAPEF